jgi:four helix bundle protein
MYNFEKLKVWQESVRLVEVVYGEIEKLPRDEKYALADQLKRAATSISLNIAEGSGSDSKKSFVLSLNIALKSLYETVSILKIAECLFNKNFNESLRQSDLAAKLLHGLIRSLKSEN